MSEGTASFPMATSASRAFVRTVGSGLARSVTSDGIRAALLSARSTLLRLVVRSHGFFANRGKVVGSNTRYASSFTRSFTRNHARA